MTHFRLQISSKFKHHTLYSYRAIATKDDCLEGFIVAVIKRKNQRAQVTPYVGVDGS